MAVNEQKFENLGLSVGGTLLYCANSIGIDASTDEIETSCKRSGSNKTYIPGGQSMTASADGVMTTADGDDAAENVTSENLFDIWANKTIVDLTFGSDLPGEAKYAAKAFITSYSNSAAFGEAGSYSVGFRVNLPMVKTINPA